MSEAMTGATAGIGAKRLGGLRRWNLVLAVLHLGQAAAMLLLTNGFSIAVLTSFPEGPPGTKGLTTSTLLNVRIGWAIALFLALAGVDHLLTATALRTVYERDLQRGINRFRWIEYSLSATIMVIVISLYWGVTTINAIVLIAGANIAMILFGWLQEEMNPPGRTATTMRPFWFGALVGIAPWIAMGINPYFYKGVPSAIYVVMFVQALFFFCFGLNQWLQYRAKGRWADYAFGEKTYLVLSLGAKSLLAWMIFAVSLVAK